MKKTAEGNVDVFKIDLIVWKSGKIYSAYECNYKFKIDLIVWKFMTLSHKHSM